MHTRSGEFGGAPRWKRLRVVPKSTRVSTYVEQVGVEQESVNIALIQRASERRSS